MNASIYKCRHLLFNSGAVDFTSLSCTRILNLNIKSIGGIELNENKPKCEGLRNRHTWINRKEVGREEGADKANSQWNPCFPKTTWTRLWLSSGQLSTVLPTPVFIQILGNVSGAAFDSWIWFPSSMNYLALIPNMVSISSLSSPAPQHLLFSPRVKSSRFWPQVLPIEWE